MNSPKLKILFVCMGNICRSPTAEGVFKAKLQHGKLLGSIHVDSAGTHNYHPNSPPDSRSQMHALKRGYDLSNLRARAVNDDDFENFDLLITMDWDNRALLEQRCPSHLQHKIRGFAEFLKTTWVESLEANEDFSNEKIAAKNFDFYLTNPITRASRTLNKCSTELQ